MSRQSDDAQIETGRKLLRLKGNPDFALFLEELQSRIDDQFARTQRGRRGVTSDSALLSALDRYHELVDLRDWMDEEIAAGSKLLEARQKETA
jgi:hypothetical protein